MVPPKRAVRFLRWFCREDYIEEIEGDLTEIFEKEVGETPRKAKWKFVWSVIKYFRPQFLKPFGNFYQSNSFGMYKNYLKITLRVFNREKLYSLINVSGLALGFLCCLMIYLFIRDEISYDKFHQDGDRVYRIASAYMRQSKWEPYSSNSWRTGELIRSNYPELKELVMICSDEGILVYKDKRIYETKMAWVGDNFFKVFSFPLVSGNPDDALRGTNKVVISESMAAKYFGAENAIGKVFEANDNSYQLQVSAVMKDMPHNSHFHFDFLMSSETLRKIAPSGMFTNVGWDSQHLYAKATPGANPALLEASFPAFIDKNLDFMKSDKFKLFLQPLKSIHLESNNGLEIEPNGSLSQVYTFSVIAIFILVIACVNYVNLTTARSLRRAKEVGVRKVMGGKQTDLVKQFLSESFIITFMAILIALVFALLLLPQFNQFAGKEIPLSVLLTPEVLLTLIASVIVIGLMAGFYPAVMLSSFKPTNNLKGVDLGGKSGFLFRRGLVILQFVISIGLIAGSTIVFQQWNFLKNKELGLNENMLISVPLQTMNRNKLDAFKEMLLADHSIKKIGTSNMKMPGWISNSTGYQAEDVDISKVTNQTMKIMRTDFDFFDAIETKFADGRNFARKFPSDSSAIIINESAVAQLGWKNPVGKWMELDNKKYTVVGVVKDFHFESLHRLIPPTIFILSSEWLNWVYVRIDNANTQHAISHLKKTYSQFVTNRDFSYSFVDEDMKSQYNAEEKFTETFTLFTALAIVIACLGTFGLISFAAERKSKEIGVRKVLGASVGQVSYLLVREFIILLVIASAISLPLTWYFLNNWVDTFIYRITIGYGPFVLAVVIAAFIVIVTTGFRAMKAAMANPVDSLRDE
ncbi:ABC transporter permease [Cytophagales bacterium WSM2-2]|nr:ABC transporter permease [Cytophagales bacterium WSM2-2]